MVLRYLFSEYAESKTAPDPVELAFSALEESPAAPISLRSLNDLPANIRQRVYRGLVPHHLLAQFDVHPITWQGPGKQVCVELEAEGGKVTIQAHSPFDPEDPFYEIEIVDNTFNSLDFNWLTLRDPQGERFDVDRDATGRSTLGGTVHRNIEAEVAAMQAGLAPGQIRRGLRASNYVFYQIKTFLIALGHNSIALEPLSYVSAWLFERNGFAYMRGHRLMSLIHEAFQPGGELYEALDGSTPFRQREQAATIRGRAWAIHDGILESIGESWNDLRMTQQIGQHIPIETAPNVPY